MPDENGNDTLMLIQGSLEFEPHPVINLVQPPSTPLIARCKPRGSYHRQDYGGLSELVLYSRRPPRAGWYRIHVHEQLARTKPGF